MNNEVVNFCSHTIFSLITRVIIVSILAILQCIAIYRFYLTFFQNRSIGLVRYMLCCLTADIISNNHSGNSIWVFSCFYEFEKHFISVIYFMPYTLFTLIVLRVSYLLIQIQFDLSSTITEESKDKRLLAIRIVFYAYAFIDFSSRFILTFMNDEAWMVNGSAQVTVSFLGLIYSVLTLGICCAMIFMAYFKIKERFKGFVGDEIRKSLANYAFIYVFCVFLYWVSFVVGACWDGFSEYLK